MNAGIAGKPATAMARIRGGITTRIASVIAKSILTRSMTSTATTPKTITIQGRRSSVRNRAPENLTTVALSAKALRNIRKLAFPNGAILSCACGCGYSSEKIAEEMEQYLKSWPRMHGFPANVRPK